MYNPARSVTVNDPERLLTVNEAADVLRLNRAVLYESIETGALPHVHCDDGVRIEAAQALRFGRSHCAEHGEPVERR